MKVTTGNPFYLSEVAVVFLPLHSAQFCLLILRTGTTSSWLGGSVLASLWPSNIDASHNIDWSLKSWQRTEKSRVDTLAPHHLWQCLGLMRKIVDSVKNCFWCADEFHLRVADLHVFIPTTDIDVCVVTVGQRAVDFAFLGPPLTGLLGDLWIAFNSFNAFSSFISFNYTTIGGLDQGY